MKQFDCEFEDESLLTALQGRWPERVDDELRVHVAGCQICADVVTVAAAMDKAREQMRGSAVRDSGQVWWRAQLRARREAALAAGGPITATQAIALACAVGLLGSCFGATSTWFQSLLRQLTAGAGRFRVDTVLSSIAAVAGGHQLLVFLFAAVVLAVVLMIPAAVYFVMLRD